MFLKKPTVDKLLHNRLVRLLCLIALCLICVSFIVGHVSAKEYANKSLECIFVFLCEKFLKIE